VVVDKTQSEKEFLYRGDCDSEEIKFLTTHTNVMAIIAHTTDSLQRVARDFSKPITSSLSRAKNEKFRKAESENCSLWAQNKKNKGRKSL
jgi:hypothetical protein